MNNKMSWTKTRGSDVQTIEATLSPVSAAIMLPVLKEAYLIPLLQGIEMTLENGDTYLCFDLPDMEAQRIKLLLMECCRKLDPNQSDN